MASKQEWKREAQTLAREVCELHDALRVECTDRDGMARRLAWIRSLVQQWHDNESIKSLPPMRRDQVLAQIAKTDHRRDAYKQVLMMFDAPVPATFGREATEDDA